MSKSEILSDNVSIPIAHGKQTFLHIIVVSRRRAPYRHQSAKINEKQRHHLPDERDRTLCRFCIYRGNWRRGWACREGL